MMDYFVPCILFFTAALALGRRENAYGLLLSGAGEGLKLLLSIVPALMVLLTAVQMLRASGAAELLSQWLGPVFAWFGIPPETASVSTEARRRICSRYSGQLRANPWNCWTDTAESHPPKWEKNGF